MFKKFYWKYYYLRSLWPVWFYVLNRRPRRLWQTYRTQVRLSAIQARVVEDLKRDGIAIAHLNDFFSDGSVVRVLTAYSNKLLADPVSQEKITTRECAKQTAKSDIIVHLLGGYGDTKHTLSIRDPFLQLTFSNEILHSVASYLDMFPLFKMCSLHSTILLPADSPEFFSQRWHRDPDDKKLVKVFLYLTDVDEQGAGPFTYIAGSHLGGRWRHFYPQVPPVGSYPPAGALEKYIPEEDKKICLGKIGTLIFCDTSGLHKGGYSTTKRRLMYAATYTSAASSLQANCALIDMDQADHFSKIARYACGMTS
ncbi:MAG: hypothetical protein AAB968_03130 [Patescibacteria group bacterium]